MVHVDLQLRVASPAPRGYGLTWAGYVDALPVADRRRLVERDKVGLLCRTTRCGQGVGDPGARHKSVHARVGDRARDVHDDRRLG